METDQSTSARGWLYKKSGFYLTWKKRFFVIKDGRISYFHTLRDETPRAVFEIKSSFSIVDGGESDGYHEFSIYDQGKRILLLSAEENKAKYWISTLVGLIEHLQKPTLQNPAESADFSVPPLAYSVQTSPLRNSVDSEILPSDMNAFSSLLHSAGLLKTLNRCEDDCLFYAIHDSPYRLMSLAVNLGIEYVAYFLVDMSRIRLLWDPFFLMNEEVESVDQNNRILRLIYKPVQLSSFPCAFSTRPRDFCVHMHYSYDEDVNAYFILFMSTAHHRCLPASGIVRGTMNVGYRLEAISPGRTQISVMYDVQPGGNTGLWTATARAYEHQLVQSVKGLRVFVEQLPESAVYNLVDSIIESARKSSDDSGETSPTGEESPQTSESINSSLSQPSQAISSNLPQPSQAINNSLPQAPLEGPKEHCWEEVDGTIWKVRSSTYIANREKKPSLPCFCKLLSVDLFHSAEKLCNVAQNPRSALARMESLPEGVSRVLVVNLQLSGGISIVAYLLVPETDGSTVSSLLERFVSEDDAWRNSRFKVLPHVVEGGYLVKKAVGMTPCLIGNKGKSVYYAGTSPVPYFECDFDMEGSTMSRNLGKYLFASSDLIVEVGFVIQGETSEELPERVLGGFRCYHLNVEKAMNV